MSRSNNRATLILIGITIITIALMLVAILLTRTTINLASMKPFGLLLCLQLTLVIYCRFRRLTGFQPVVETIFLLLTLNFGLLPITYAGMRFDYPIADGWLSGMDQAMGFDWRGFISSIDGEPLSATALFGAYTSFAPQLFVIPAYFAICGNVRRASAMISAYTAIVIVSTAIGIFFPSEGAFHFYGLDQSHLKNINIHFGIAYLSEFQAVRSQPIFEMSLDRVQGLLTFPSVHAAGALLCAWAAWGSRYLRVPAIVLNTAMAVSAISHGGHFAIDILAGFFIAIICILLSLRLFEGADTATARAAEAAFWRSVLKGKLRPRRPSPALPASTRG